MKIKHYWLLALLPLLGRHPRAHAQAVSYGHNPAASRCQLVRGVRLY